jgi:hypothetical protein
VERVSPEAALVYAAAWMVIAVGFWVASATADR